MSYIVWIGGDKHSNLSAVEAEKRAVEADQRRLPYMVCDEDGDCVGFGNGETANVNRAAAERYGEEIDRARAQRR